jgi:hypothetical protein
VANTPRTLAKTSALRARWGPTASLPDTVVARASAVLLWVLVVLAALGGLFAWLRSDGDAAPATRSSDAGGVTEAAWMAAGFAERYVSSYLLAGSDGASLSPFLGYRPELPPTQRPAEVAAPARAVDVRAAGEDYWAITVSVGPPGQERFWRTAVDTQHGHSVAVGLPSAVAGPPAEVQRADLAVTLTQPPADDPVAETMTGFLTAYLCGTGDLARYLRPDLELTAANPAVCTTVELSRWGTTSNEGDDRTVVVEALLVSGTGDAASVQQSTYAVDMVRRDGRWEVAELLPAPPREQDETD